MPPAKKPALLETTLPDGRSLRLTSSGARFFVGVFEGTTRLQQVPVLLTDTSGVIIEKLNIPRAVADSIVAKLTDPAAADPTAVAIDAAAMPPPPPPRPPSAAGGSTAKRPCDEAATADPVATATKPASAAPLTDDHCGSDSDSDSDSAAAKPFVAAAPLHPEPFMDYHKPRTADELATALSAEAARLGVTVDHPLIASHVVDITARRTATATEITAATAAEAARWGITEQQLLKDGYYEARMDPDGRFYLNRAGAEGLEEGHPDSWAERVRRQEVFPWGVDDLRRGPAGDRAREFVQKMARRTA